MFIYSCTVLDLSSQPIFSSWTEAGHVMTLVICSVSNSGQNFETRVSGSWEKKPGKTRFFGFWNECDFER